ncbi:TonB-dependent receptor [Methylosinus sp. H3A]|uniref:TonB-dependent receptor n=1 Tax=Methylosinus sp. H3A TaxID=2785786 RepID=UPI0018C339F7|nr:TonB-dependent receptor [Methylosinus sp. H3A]MBG0811775.1 TonB-dependent receptor [Methylosinus sp. H3A]
MAISTLPGRSRAEEAPTPVRVEIGDVVVPDGDEDRGETSRSVMDAQKKPRTIFVVDPKAIERENINRLDEFQQKIPSYRANNGAVVRSARQTMRWVGIGAGTGVGTESPTGYVVDNVFWKYWGFQWGELFDLQSFEVAYGPQGTAGGKNTAVGSLIIRSQLPSFTRKATFETNYANFGRVIEKASVTGPIIDDTLAYRLSAFLDKSGGWIHDQVSGAGYKNTDRWAVRGQLLYVGDNFSDRLIFNYNQSHEYNGYNLGPIGDTSLIYANGTLPSATFARNVATRLGKPILSYNPYTPSIAGMGADPVRNIMVSNEINWGIGENILTSLSAYGYSRNEESYREETQLLGLWRTGMDTNVGQASQEFRFSSPKEQELEWTTGVYLFYDDAGNQMHHVQFGSDAAKWLRMPAALPGVEDWWYTKARDIQFAAFGQATWHYDEQLAITLGFRNSYEIRQGSVSHLNRYYPTLSIVDQDQAIIAAGGYGLSDRGGQSRSSNHVTGILNPQYRWTENILLFGLVGRAEKAAAVNTSGNPTYATDAATGQKVFSAWTPLFTKPEVSWDYELGFKTNWLDNKLLFNANFYWNDFYNFQTTTVDASRTDALGAPISVSSLGNADHARLRGVELDARWSPIERLWITGNAAFSDARWISYPDAAPPTDWQWTTGGPAPKYLSLSNTRWQSVPLWTFNIGANYEHPLGAVLIDSGLDTFGDFARQPMTAFGYVNVNWQDKTQLTNPWSIVQFWQPSYAIVNFGFGLRTDDDRYSLSFWAKNVFDERPYSSFDPGSASNPTRVGLARWPATFGGAFRVKLM